MIRMLAGILLLAAAVQARSMRIEDFHASVRVNEDGSVDVTETISVAFHGRWNGILRHIPYRYRDSNGFNVSTRLEVVSVRAGPRKALEYTEKREGGVLRLKIRVPEASNATRTVEIRYRVERVIKTWGEQDELYWTVTGNAWSIPISRASADVTLPGAIPPESIRTQAFTGSYGGRGQDYTVKRGDPVGSIRFETTGGLRPHDGLTIVVRFPFGYVEHPSGMQELFWSLADNWTLLIPVLALALWWGIWFRKGRDPIANETIVPEFEAPFDLSPTEIGVLADDRMHPRDLTAAFIDLARRGVIKIEEIDDGENHMIRAVGGRKARDGLRPFEEELLEAVFPDGKPKNNFKRIRHGFAPKFERIRKTVMAGLVKQKFYDKGPEKVRGAWALRTVGLIAGLVVLGLILQASSLYYIVLAICGIFMLIIAHQMPRRTKKGLEALRRIRGMEEYLETAEKERMKDLPKEQIEALLPAAIALGLHAAWVEAFASLYEQPPAWLATRGSHAGFRLALNAFVYSSDSTVGFVTRTSSPSGGVGGWSGGSGFSSGGGFSGGGFGGGGGGGW